MKQWNGKLLCSMHGHGTGATEATVLAVDYDGYAMPICLACKNELRPHWEFEFLPDIAALRKDADTLQRVRATMRTWIRGCADTYYDRSTLETLTALCDEDSDPGRAPDPSAAAGGGVKLQCAYCNDPATGLEVDTILSPTMGRAVCNDCFDDSWKHIVLQPLPDFAQLQRNAEMLAKVRTRVETWGAADIEHAQDPGLVDLHAMTDLAELLGVKVESCVSAKDEQDKLRMLRRDAALLAKVREIALAPRASGMGGGLDTASLRFDRIVDLLEARRKEGTK